MTQGTPQETPDAMPEKKGSFAKTYLLRNADLLVVNFLATVGALRLIKCSNPLWNVLAAEAIGASAALGYDYLKQKHHTKHKEEMAASR